ncbi:cardiolipin-specific deacylase 1, mitochondrial [[Candida] anglica]|uniref:Cardiolipin-specific deacylase 1, mitochondrial n=1 Tax=[Candida] anglica TaxID=148631 RepID=A0ABP0EES7_9ASCO
MFSRLRYKTRDKSILIKWKQLSYSNTSYRMASSVQEEGTHAKQVSSKQNEFNDGRFQPQYSWGSSIKDWIKQATVPKYSDALVEHNLLSMLPFYPESDGKRIATVVNTPISNGNYIHELYIENTEKPKTVTESGKEQIKDVVLVHGYAASLGLFIDNFDALSSIPGIRIHAIDLLGFGFSSRPTFPNFPSNTKAEVEKVEDWFIDSLEEWRQNRKLDKFILMGHSFGGYLSCAYALKYNKNLIDAATGATLNPVEKLVLISPVGLERNKFSVLNNPTNEKNLQAPDVPLTREMTDNQEDIINNEISPESNRFEEEPQTKGQKLFRYLWKNNYSPFSIVRNMGPIKSKLISRWTTHRFAHIYLSNPQQFYAMHDYIYRIFNGKGSGEFAITRVLAVGALPKLPLLDRCPQKFADMKLPTFWMYGDKDWMNEKAGYQMTREINQLAGSSLAKYAILPNAGHHLYLDNPTAFSKEIFNFLDFKK